MKLKLCTIILLTLVFSSCMLPTVTGSGNLVTRELAYTDFTRIEGNDVMQITIVYGGSFSVSVTADDNIIDDYFLAEQYTETLAFSLEGPYSFQNITIEITVQMPELDSIDLEDVAMASISGFVSDSDFSAELSDASSLDGTILCGSGELELNLADASQLNLVGSAQAMQLNMTDAASAHLSSFTVPDADCTMSGATHAYISCGDTISIYLDDASRLYNNQNPSIISSHISTAADYIVQ